jgi:hypothetical protein
MMKHWLEGFYQQLVIESQKNEHTAFTNKGPHALQTLIHKQQKQMQELRYRRVRNGYLRNRMFYEPNKPVIYLMDWAPHFFLTPHEHHNRPCFLLIVKGQIVCSTYIKHQIDGTTYTLELKRTTVFNPMDICIVDETDTDIHSMFITMPSQSLHIYPDDYTYYQAFHVKDDHTYSRKPMYVNPS